MAKKTITVQGVEIRIYKDDKEDFISLTDIAKKFNERTGQLILNWLRNRSTVSFLGLWEQLYNSDFNVLEFEEIRNKTGDAAFILSAKNWINKTNAIGIISKTGRYGGTYAHKDIAMEFLSYLSPSFKLYVIREFQRLKIEETKELEWNAKRMLTKMNYKVHSDAIKAELIPSRVKNKGFVYANEADILNVAVFGITSKMWRSSNEEKKGNIRDYASPEQLLLLANLEAVNAELIRMGLGADERMDRLNVAAIKQMESLLSSSALKGLDLGEKK